jgi:hypothetical protein
LDVFVLYVAAGQCWQEEEAEAGWKAGSHRHSFFKVDAVFSVVE